MHRGMIRFYRKFFSKQYPLPFMAIVAGTVWARFGLLAAKELLTRPLRKQTSIATGLPTIPYYEKRKSAPVVAYIGPERRTNRQVKIPKEGSNVIFVHDKTPKHDQSNT